MNEPQNETNIVPCLLAHAIGDCLGLPHEFDNDKPDKSLRTHDGAIYFRFCTKYYKKGQISDDTEMTFALFRVLRNNGMKYDRNKVLHEYMLWANSKPFGMGYNTSSLLRGVKTVNGFEARWRKKDFINVQGNGALMRAVPLTLIDEAGAIEDCRLTNDNEVSIACVIWYRQLILNLINAQTSPLPSTFFHLFPSTTCLLLQDYIDKGKNLERLKINGRNKGWIILPIYLISYYLTFQVKKGPVDTESLKHVYSDLIQRGGDTDTNCAIVGAVFGTLIDTDSIKSSFKDMITDMKNNEYNRKRVPELATILG